MRETPPHSNAGRSGTFRSRRPRRRRSCKPSVASSLIAARRGRCKAAVGKNSPCATGQTSTPISATRPVREALRRFAGTEKEKTNEISDYSVFVAWAYRLLLRWSLHRARRGFKRLRRFGGHPGRPVVPSPYANSTKIAQSGEKALGRAPYLPPSSPSSPHTPSWPVVTCSNSRCARAARRYWRDCGP